MNEKLVKTVEAFISELNTEYQLTHINTKEDLHKLIDGAYLIDTPQRKTMPKLGPCQFVSYALHKKLQEDNIPSTFLAQKIVENNQNFLHFLVESEGNYIELIKDIYLSPTPELILQKNSVSTIKEYHAFNAQEFPEEYDKFWKSTFTKDWAGRYTEQHLLNLYNRMPNKEAEKPNYKLILSDTLQS